MIPKIKVGRTEMSTIQYGWWKAGGPPYFKRPSLEQLVAVRKCLLELGISSDNAPAYAKGFTEMMMWGGYSYLEDWWLETGRTTRRKNDIVFSKCGLYWPAESRQNTHGDMHWCIDKLLGKDANAVTPEEVKNTILGEFHDSCVRMHVDYIHGYMLHWPLRSEDQEIRVDWMLEGVIPAFAELYKKDKVGAIGFGNVENKDMLLQLNERAIAEGKKLGIDGFAVHFIQNECSVLNLDPNGNPFGAKSIYQSELADYCISEGIVRVAYSALGHGAPISPPGDFIFLDHWGISEERQRRIYKFKKSCHQEFAKLAEDIGCPPPILALSWLIAQDIVPLFSSMSPAHIKENCEALDFVNRVKMEEKLINQWVENYQKDFAKLLN